MRPFSILSCVAAATLILLSACGGGDHPTAAGDAPPAITISGIADGGTYDPPVVAHIDIDKGSYQATIDGAPYLSGDTIRLPGTHTLTVAAHVGLAAATRNVQFTLRAPPGGALIIRMLNLGANESGGGGDAILITDSSSAGMTHALIDAGPAGVNASDRSFVSRQLTALHADTLDLLLLTHAHDDHYGGMAPILSSQHVRRFLYNGQVRNLASYNNVIAQAQIVADSVIVVSALRDYALGTAAVPSHLTFLSPLTTHLGVSTDDGTLINDGSVGARLELGTFSMLFTGDGEVDANVHWRTAFPDLVRNITVLKVGHHGANNAIFDNGFSGLATWLDQTAPAISIISANGTTHPRIAARNRLLAQPNNRTYCTNVHGVIVIRVTRTGTYSVSVEKNANQDCVAGSGADS